MSRRLCQGVTAAEGNANPFLHPQQRDVGGTPRASLGYVLGMLGNESKPLNRGPRAEPAARGAAPSSSGSGSGSPAPAFGAELSSYGNMGTAVICFERAEQVF